jgi:hypothetical protein
MTGYYETGKSIGKNLNFDFGGVRLEFGLGNRLQ